MRAPINKNLVNGSIVFLLSVAKAALFYCRELIVAAAVGCERAPK
jgi:hypothetical protein